MGFCDLWNRTLVYFGIAEDEEWDDDGLADERGSSRRATAGATARTSAGFRARPRQDEWAVRRGPVRAASARRGCAASIRARPAKVHLVVPRSFNDAKQIADRFKAQIPVILNLQSADTELSKRLIDFASGLTYALDGSMQRVADKVFLLTPRDVELSAEERARAIERGGFYNQA